MKVHLVKMMRNGIEIKKSMLYDRFNRPPFGTLQIGDSTDNGMHRNSIRAYFIREGDMTSIVILLDCHVL